MTFSSRLSISPRIVDIYNRFKISIAFKGKSIIKTKWAILREIVPYKMTTQNGKLSNQFLKKGWLLFYVSYYLIFILFMVSLFNFHQNIL